jgi:hypothetical protein
LSPLLLAIAIAIAVPLLPTLTLSRCPAAANYAAIAEPFPAAI